MGSLEGQAEREATETLAKEIARDFVTVAALAGMPVPLSAIDIEELAAPHKPPSSLPKERMAVYVFLYGERCLKVGKAGQRSAARYCSQHYGFRAPSTLARSLVASQSRDFSDVNEDNVEAWIRRNTRRINFLIPSSYGVFLLSLMEMFIQCRLKPEFEGFESQRVSLSR